MQTILQPSAKTLKILGKPKSSDNKMRWMQYVLPKPVDDGVLLFHTLTRELILLTNEEYEYPDRFLQLHKKWFRVPDNIIDKQYADVVRMVIESLHKKSKYINSYTIFTTTDCNARCFYCYELGRSRIPMSEETAHKAATYIINHCGGKPVKLNWFGGEPLYNKKVIDIICSDLKDKDIKYVSSMVTNAYLFDEETVDQAVDLWNLKDR